MKKFNNATQTYTLQCHCHNRLCHTVHWIGTVCNGACMASKMWSCPYLSSTPGILYLQARYHTQLQQEHEYRHKTLLSSYCHLWNYLVNYNKM